MLQELFNLVKEHATAAVVNNPAVPDEHNEAVMQEASSSIMSSLQGLVQNGNLSELTNMLQSGGQHPAMQEAQNNFIGNIMQKFGIDGGAAQSIAASLIPAAMNSLTNKVANNNGGLDLGNIMSSLGSGNFNMNELSNIGAKLGLDKDGDGDVDLNDLTKMFK